MEEAGGSWPVKEDERAEYWNRKWKLKEHRLRERVGLDGSDGEHEFLGTGTRESFRFLTGAST